MTALRQLVRDHNLWLCNIVSLFKQKVDTMTKKLGYFMLHCMLEESRAIKHLLLKLLCLLSCTKQCS